MYAVDHIRYRPLAVLFDRDGTLIVDVPYNTDPAAVAPTHGARDALDRLRAAGIAVGVLTNQSGVGRGLFDRATVDRINARVDDLLGPFDTWQVCPHAPDHGCECRKPQPGMVLAAAEDLGVSPSECVVVGDIGSDIRAAVQAGAEAILVPTKVTLPGEIDVAPLVAADLTEAVDVVFALPPQPVNMP